MYKLEIKPKDGACHRWLKNTKTEQQQTGQHQLSVSWRKSCRDRGSGKESTARGTNTCGMQERTVKRHNCCRRRGLRHNGSSISRTRASSRKFTGKLSSSSSRKSNWPDARMSKRKHSSSLSGDKPVDTSLAAFHRGDCPLKLYESTRALYCSSKRIDSRLPFWAAQLKGESLLVSNEFTRAPFSSSVRTQRVLFLKTAQCRGVSWFPSGMFTSALWRNSVSMQATSRSAA